MRSRRPLAGLTAALALAVPAAVTATTADAATQRAKRVQVSEYRVSDSAMRTLRDRFVRRTLARYPNGSWAPLKMQLTDRDLKLMGLPPKRVLLSRSYKRPTMLSRSGQATAVDLPAVASFAGTGYFGIRPGAWLLLLTGGGVGWCSMSHVTGSPGAYKVTTAGHCGKVGDTATVIAAFGNRAGTLQPILLDFGKFATSRDGGVGDDYASISIDPRYQHLVTPTMAFWGGPRGVFTKSGAVAGVQVPRNGLVPAVSANPDPFLAQQIVHYGHGTGVGAGGTPRSATAIHWGARHYMFFGAIAPGDSGSGANTLLGDTAGANMEAAGNITHLYVDPLMRQGLGIMAGTRTTIIGTPANGQLVGYPAPVPVAP